MWLMGRFARSNPGRQRPDPTVRRRGRGRFGAWLRLPQGCLDRPARVGRHVWLGTRRRQRTRDRRATQQRRAPGRSTPLVECTGARPQRKRAVPREHPPNWNAPSPPPSPHTASRRGCGGRQGRKGGRFGWALAALLVCTHVRLGAHLDPPRLGRSFDPTKGFPGEGPSAPRKEPLLEICSSNVTAWSNFELRTLSDTSPLALVQ